MRVFTLYTPFEFKEGCRVSGGVVGKPASSAFAKAGVLDQRELCRGSEHGGLFSVGAEVLVKASVFLSNNLRPETLIERIRKSALHLHGSESSSITCPGAQGVRLRKERRSVFCKHCRNTYASRKP